MVSTTPQERRGTIVQPLGGSHSRCGQVRSSRDLSRHGRDLQCRPQVLHAIGTGAVVPEV